MDIKERIGLWWNAFRNPKDVFSSEKSRASFGDGAANIVLGALFAGIIVGIWKLSAISIIFGSIKIIILQFLSWIIGGGVLYVFAKIFGGRGDYITQIYLISLYTPVYAVLGAILFPIPKVGGILAIILFIYMLFLLTLALREAHAYSTGRAIATWLVPFLIFVVIVVALVLVLTSLILGNLAPLLMTGKFV